VSKLLKAKKLKAPGRVYVSVLISQDTKDHALWLTKFYGRLSLEVRGAPDRFEDVTRTNEGEAGDLVDGPEAHGRTFVSAVVSVLTDVYLLENIDRRNAPATGELARFLDRKLAAANVNRDDEVEVEIYLAPLEQPEWTWKIRGIRLDDQRLTRLRDTRFALPSEGEAVATQQIQAAARRIVIDPEEEELEAP
jgi:hypothetical protein